LPPPLRSAGALNLFGSKLWWQLKAILEAWRRDYNETRFHMARDEYAPQALQPVSRLARLNRDKRQSIEDRLTRSSKEIQRTPDDAKRMRPRPRALPRVALVTNIPAPYRVPVYNRVVADGRIDLTVIFCAEREPDRHWDYERIEFKSMVLRESYFTWKGRYIHNNFDVLEQLKAIDPAVVITDGFNPTFLYAFFYAWWHGCKQICSTDGILASERDLSVVHRWIRRIVFKRSAAFLGGSEGSLELYRSYGCANDRLFKSHLCVDNERFRDARSQPKSFDLLFCGRLTQTKQPLFAIDVAERAAALLGRRLSLLFVGAGDLELQLREKAASAAGVDVSFHGFATQAELPGLYGSARIFLFPTSWDPWGVVANEACAAGLPVIATPFAGAVGEIIRDGENAFVRNPELEEWAAAVQRLLTDEHRYEEFSRNSLRLVAGHNYNAAAAGVINASLAALA